MRARAELIRYVAALRGALRWHQETGDAALPVPAGFRLPPLGSAAPARRTAPPVVAPAPAPARASTPPPAFSGDRAAALAALEEEARQGAGTPRVTGRGGAAARLLFVAEAPRPDAADGAKTAEMLDRLVAAVKLPDDQVHVCFVAAPGAGPGESGTDALAACASLFERRVAVLQPRVIVAFGAPLGRWLTGERGQIAVLRGRWLQYAGLPLVVTFPPALLVANPDLKRPVWDDLKMVMRKLGTTPETGR